MTLSDIDEDDVVPPPRAPPAPVAAATKQAPPKQNAGVSLDDLFGDFASAAIVSPPPAPPPLNPTASSLMANDPLDMLFSNSPPPLSTASGGNTGGAVLYVDGNTDHESNLLDLSRPAARQKHQNADTFLDAFDRQCRRGAGGGGGGSGRFDNAESLAHLTRNTDDNKVRARLLALMNYYDVLGVSSTASTEEIRRSYKKKALELHPDRVGREQTAEEQELFKVITKANEVLTDDTLRSKYDAELSASSGDTNGANWLNYVRND